MTAAVLGRCRGGTAGPHLIAEFWDSQLASLGNLARSGAPSQAKRGGAIDPSIRPAAGGINILDPRQLPEFCGLWGSKWLGQFSAGFPIDGDLSQAKDFHRKNPKESLLPKKQLPDPPFMTRSSIPLLITTGPQSIYEMAYRRGHRNCATAVRGRGVLRRRHQVRLLCNAYGGSSWYV